MAVLFSWGLFPLTYPCVVLTLWYRFFWGCNCGFAHSPLWGHYDRVCQASLWLFPHHTSVIKATDCRLIGVVFSDALGHKLLHWLLESTSGFSEWIVIAVSIGGFLESPGKSSPVSLVSGNLDNLQFSLCSWWIYLCLPSYLITSFSTVFQCP